MEESLNYILMPNKRRKKKQAKNIIIEHPPQQNDKKAFLLTLCCFRLVLDMQVRPSRPSLGIKLRFDFAATRIMCDGTTTQQLTLQ